jgi:hypothetical protein
VDVNVPQANTSLVLLQLQLLLPTVLLTTVMDLTSTDSQTVSVPFDPVCSATTTCQLDSTTAARMINAGVASQRLRLSSPAAWRSFPSASTYAMPTPTAVPNRGAESSGDTKTSWTPIVVAIVALAALCVVLIFTITRTRAKRRAAVAHQHEDGYLDTQPSPADMLNDPFKTCQKAQESCRSIYGYHDYYR